MIKLLILILLLSSCKAIKSPDIVYHGLNVVDAYQTQTWRHNNCYESTFITKDILGREPQPAETVLFFIATSLGYQWLINHIDSKFKNWVRGILIGGKLIYIVHNTGLNCK